MRNRISLNCIVVGLCLFNFIPKSTFGQERIVDGLYWLRVQTNFEINELWTGSFELEERRFLGPDRAHQRVLPEFKLFYKLKDRYQLGIGYTNFSIRGPQTAELAIEQVLSEQRYAFIAKSKWKWLNSSIVTQFKTELRNFDRDPLNGQLNYLDYLIRLRFLGAYQYPIAKNWQLKIGDELHLHTLGNVDYQLFDQNRIFTGLSFSKGDWSYGLDYLYWYQKNRKGSVYYHRHILRFTCIYSFSFR